MTRPFDCQVEAVNGRTVAENFGAWFDGSAAVDAKGAPMLLFHGTNCDFDAFDPEEIGANMNVDRRGFFFTNDADTAEYFAAPDDRGYSEKDRWDGANIIPVFVCLRAPLRIEEVLESMDYSVGDLFEDYDHVGEFFDIARPEILKLARERGCDGVWFELEGFVQCVAFEPSQIKSAIANSGLYLRGSCSLTDLDQAVALKNARMARDELAEIAPARRARTQR